MNEPSTSSGYLGDATDVVGIDSTFSQLEVMPSRGHNVVARARRYGRWWVLKGLKPEAADASHREMLIKELDTLMQLQHPGIVQAVGMDDVPPLGMCIVMEWVDGVTLSRWLTEDHSPTERDRVLDGLLDAVAAVHAHDMVHRDIKPSNIMVTHNAHNVKLIDFGLADTDSHAVLKQPAGTPGYVAPEQAAIAMPDVRNDIYSLGMVMRQLVPQSRYRSIIGRCLAPIDERPASVKQLQELIAHARNRSRRRWTAALIAAGIILVAAVAVMGVQLNHMSTRDALLADSLHTQLAHNARHIEQSRQQQEALQGRLANLNDSLAAVVASNSDLLSRQAEQQAVQQRIDRAIAQGIARIDRVNAATHLEHHLDTVTSRAYVWVDWHNLSQAGLREALNYLAQLRGTMNDKELMEVEYALLDHCTQWEQKIQKRRDKFEISNR